MRLEIPTLCKKPTELVEFQHAGTITFFLNPLVQHKIYYTMKFSGSDTGIRNTETKLSNLSVGGAVEDDRKESSKHRVKLQSKARRVQ